MKALKKALIALLGAMVCCCFFVGCLSTKVSVTYMVDGETYRVQEYEMDTQVSLPTPPTKEGYSFIGWYTDAALTIPYAEGKITAGITLYAKFNVSSVYIVVNTDGGEKINAIEVAPGADYTIPEAVKEGHTFLGYTYVDDNGDEQSFPLSGKYPNNVSIRITAKYEVNKYEVTFVGEGESTQEVAYGSTAVVPNTDRAGYTFEGWYTSATEQTDATKFDVTSAIKDNITLYAKYTANDYVISILPNGGTFANASDAMLTVTFGETYTLAEPTRVGYTFAGYVVDATEAPFEKSGKYTTASNLTLEATWTKDSYTVTWKNFDTEEVLSTVENVEYNQKVSVPSAQAGYELVAVYAADKTTVVDVEETGIVGNTELYVKYAPKTYTITVNGVEDGYVNPTVKYGETYTLVTPDRGEGYDFAGFERNGEDFPATGEYTWTENIVVRAKWVTENREIKFHDGEKELTGLRIVLKYEDALSAVTLPNVPAKTGYSTDNNWYTDAACTQEFVAEGTITDDITLYAKYVANDYKITIIDNYQVVNVKYEGEYTLPDSLTKKGYLFNGYETLDGVAFAKSGKYTTAGDTNVRAKWTEDKVSVQFNLTEVGQATQTVEVLRNHTVTAIEAPAKVGYTFDGWYTKTNEKFNFATEITEDITTLTAKYTANEYTITFKVWDSATKTTKDVLVKVVYDKAITVPTPAVRDAYILSGYVYNGETFDVTKAYTYVENITVEEKWELDPNAKLLEYNKDKHWFTERVDFDADWTYVYFVGTTYKFADAQELSIITAGGEELVSIAGAELTALAVGTLELQIKYSNGDVTRQTVKIVEDIKSVALLGTNYDVAWGLNTEGDYKRNYTGVWDATFTVGKEVMLVGKVNFIPELSYNGKVTAFDSNFTATVTVDGVETADYTVANGAINFGDSLVGKKVVVTVAPKYAASDKHKAVYEVEVNNARNVYSHEDMMAAFANASVTEVNVLRNIIPTVTSDMVNTFVDEWGKTQISPKSYVRVINPNTNDYYKTRYCTGVYVRLTGNMKINGNYFTVDGSKLPLTDARDGEVDVNKPGTGFGVLDTRFSIFLFGRRHWGNRGQYQIDNLNIQGNGDMDAAASYKYDGVDVLKYSGATLNVNISGGTLTMNNVTSRFGSFGLYGYTHSNFTDACGVVIKATDCKIEKNWANNIYLQGFTDVTLDSCFIGVANGAAIHSDTVGSEIAMDAKLNLINGTDIQNWVNGNEAWFKAQGLGSVIGSIKSLIDPGLKEATGMLGQTKTVVKNQAGGEYVNFAVLVRQIGDNSEWIADKKEEGYLSGMDSNFINGYLKSKYSSCSEALDALRPGFSYMDIEYVGFMQAAGYSMDVMGAYLTQHISDKLVKARAEMGGLIEVYVEMINA